MNLSPWPAAGNPPGDTLRRGLMTGFTPLLTMIAGVALTLGLSTLVGRAFAGQGFLSDERATITTLIVCAALTVLAFIIAAVRAFRAARSWREASATVSPMAALWALGATALLLLTPLLLAILLPQFPAPIAP